MYARARSFEQAKLFSLSFASSISIFKPFKRGEEYSPVLFTVGEADGWAKRTCVPPRRASTTRKNFILIMVASLFHGTPETNRENYRLIRAVALEIQTHPPTMNPSLKWNTVYALDHFLLPICKPPNCNCVYRYHYRTSKFLTL